MLYMQRQQPSVDRRTPLHPTVNSIERRTTRRAIFELMRDERCEVELVMLPIVGTAIAQIGLGQCRGRQNARSLGAMADARLSRRSKLRDGR